MATEALVTDQTAVTHVEEMKASDEIKNITEESSSQPKDLEGKDEEENLKVEDSTIVEASTTELEEKPEHKIDDTVVEKLKKEEAEEKAPVSDVPADDGLGKEFLKEENSKPESDIPTALEPAGEIVGKEFKNQGDVCMIPEPPNEAVEETAENLDTSLVPESESMVGKEPAASETATEEVKSAVLPELSSVREAEGKQMEPLMVSTITEPASDAITTSVVSESAKIFQDEIHLPKELVVSPEASKEEPLVTDLINPEDASDKIREPVASESSEDVAVVAAEVNEAKEVRQGVVVSDVPAVSVKADIDTNSIGCVEESAKEEKGCDAIDAKSVTEVDEGFAEQKLKVEEEKQEKALLVEEPTISEMTKTDAVTEVAEVSSEGLNGEKDVGILEGLVETSKDLDPASIGQILLEGEKTSEGVEVVEEKSQTSEAEKASLVETSRDLDAEGRKISTNTASEEQVGDSKQVGSESKPDEDKKEETGKSDQQNLVDPTKDCGETPKQEVPAKPSHRQSNNIISKVKHSLGKVKKAIIGKSPSSKTMSSEVKDDIKVK